MPPDRQGRHYPVLLTVSLAVFVLLGCTEQLSSSSDPSGVTPTPSPSAPPTAPPWPAPTAAPPPPPGGALATEALQALTVKGRSPRTGYSRDQFGQAWADTDRNGCDTRNDILGRDLTDKTLKPGTWGCVVLTGRLLEPYAGQPRHFQRGAETSMAVQIDHVVALSDAWQTGAGQWSPDKRLAYANDPLVLLAVDGPLNQQKGASDAASWLPPAKPFRCTYVARQIAIKRKYGLWVKPAEKAAMQRVLTACPEQPLVGLD